MKTIQDWLGFDDPPNNIQYVKYVYCPGKQIVKNLGVLSHKYKMHLLGYIILIE